MNTLNYKNKQIHLMPKILNNNFIQIMFKNRYYFLNFKVYYEYQKIIY